jgi:hypothetical protein
MSVRAVVIEASRKSLDAQREDIDFTFFVASHESKCPRIC